MSETAGTIIKLLAALTSPKACVKYITVAICLFLSWKYLEPTITETNVSKEQLSIIVLLLGVGVGSLIGHFIAWAIGEVWSRYENSKSEKLRLVQLEGEEKARKLKSVESKAIVLKKITKAFDHLHFEQKETLRKLSLDNKTLEMIDSGNSALEANGYIQKILHVKGANHLVQISPIIKDFISTQWKAEIESKVSDFIECNDSSASLLSLLKNNPPESKDLIDLDLVSNLSQHSGCIRGMNDDREGSEGYWVWFEDYLMPEFEKQTKSTYVDEAFIANDRIAAAESPA